MSHKIYLIPSNLSEDLGVISNSVVDVIKRTDYYFVENIRSARRFISSLKTERKIEDLHFYLVDKKTEIGQLNKFFKEVGKANIGVISEAGCPGIADPGNIIVQYAYKNSIQVVPLSGPSSIFMALMASGMNGQHFSFHGYLPIEKKDRIRRIKQLEETVVKTGYSQIFMETPYRNNQLMDDILNTLNSSMQLCVACDITAETEFIQTNSIKEWKSIRLDLHKRPTIFIINRSK